MFTNSILLERRNEKMGFPPTNLIRAAGALIQNHNGLQLWQSVENLAAFTFSSQSSLAWLIILIINK